MPAVAVRQEFAPAEHRHLPPPLRSSRVRILAQNGGVVCGKAGRDESADLDVIGFDFSHDSSGLFPTFLPASPGFTSSRTTSGGAGTRRRGRCSANWTTPSGARPRTTRCSCSAACRARRSTARRPTRRSSGSTRPGSRGSMPCAPRASAAGRGGPNGSRRIRPGSSRISPPSSRCTNRFRSTPAGSACSPATIAKRRATSGCR